GVRRKLQSGGVMRGMIATGEVDPAELADRAKSSPQMEGADLVKDVTCPAPYDWPADKDADDPAFLVAPERRAKRRLTIAAYDLGIKMNILRRLAAHNCDVRVFPAATAASELLGIRPDGVFLSNGPGDPAALPYVIDNVSQLVKSDTPVF